MGRGLNKVQLIGNLGRDPERRYTPGGQPTTMLSVAVGRTRKGLDGQQTEETDWFRVVCWGKLAENAGEYLKKGKKIYVEGRLQIRKYTDRSGQEKTVVEIMANQLLMLTGQEKAAQPAAAKSTSAGSPEEELFGAFDDLGF
jgi:single-strand DNA-binding protein